MTTLKQVRDDLRAIRYYYAKQKEMDDAAQTVGANIVKETADKYNKAVRNAPPRLYDLYVGLYVNNNSQCALAEEWNYCNDYIKQLNLELCEFFIRYWDKEN